MVLETENSPHAAAVVIATDLFYFQPGNQLQQFQIRQAHLLLSQVAGGKVGHALRQGVEVGSEQPLSLKAGQVNSEIEQVVR